MGYERDYGRRPERERGYGGNHDQGRSDQGRAPSDYDHDDRGFFDRAGDEVRSWFGDEEAERRRRFDSRYDERGNEQRQSGYGQGSRSSHDRGGYAGGSGSGYGRGSPNPGAGGGDRAMGYGQTGYAGGGGYDPGDYGQQSTGESSASRYAGYGRSGGDYDRWRNQQISQLDRDYDEYSRENQSRFDSEFSSWRGKRQTQRQSMDKVKEHMDVVGSDGQHVGTVDKVRGERILLTKNDQDAGGHHHSIPTGWIDQVDDKVTINKTAEEAHKQWRDEERNQAFFGENDHDQNRDRGNGPHILDRSFSGTYRS